MSGLPSHFERRSDVVLQRGFIDDDRGAFRAAATNDRYRLIKPDHAWRVTCPAIQPRNR